MWLAALSSCHFGKKKSSLTSKGQPGHLRAPWPRYSRKLTFWNYRPRPIICQLEFWIVGFSPGGVDLWPKLSNLEEQVDLSETGLGFCGFQWVSGIFLKAMGSQILAFQCDSDCIMYLNACHDKSIDRFLDLFCVCIDDGVRVQVGPWRGFKFQLDRGARNYILGHSQAEGAV